MTDLKAMTAEELLKKYANWHRGGELNNPSWQDIHNELLRRLQPEGQPTSSQQRLIGNLLTRWELMTNDFKSVVNEEERNFYEAMHNIVKAVDNGDFWPEPAVAHSSSAGQSVDCRDFYELMQKYRHWPVEDQAGTLRAYQAVIDYVQSLFPASQQQAVERCVKAEEQKDGAYAERDRLVCALSKLFPASLERHPDSDTTWDNDWRWIVFIDLPTGQATWHIHDSELAWFNHLPRFTGKVWDGHTTPEKYARLAALSASPSTQISSDINKGEQHEL